MSRGCDTEKDDTEEPVSPEREKKCISYTQKLVIALAYIVVSIDSLVKEMVMRD